MPTSPSYKKSECCGGCDCDFLDEDEGETCWGQVELSGIDLIDEDGYEWISPTHVCQGHLTAYWDDKARPSDPHYRPEPEEAQ